MRARVYHGPGQWAWEEVPDPETTDESDVIVRVDATTTCGIDLHTLASDVPEVHPGRILGPEAGVRDITITTCLVDASSTPTLMRLVASGQLDVGRFVTHPLGIDDFEQAYDLFGDGAANGALKVVLTREEDEDQDEDEEVEDE